MDRIKLDPNSRYGRTVRIGFEGENAVRKIDFDMADWQTKYGEGSLTLFVIRQGDTVPYPVSLTIDNEMATWTVTSTDCAKQGRGAIQLKYTVGTVVKKSCIFGIICCDALDETDIIPDGYVSWLATLTDLAALCESYARRAEAAAEGGGGTSNYEALINKPQIENIELAGNKTFDDFGLSNISNMRLEQLLTI